MQPYLQTFQETLRAAQVSVTRPRILIFTILSSNRPLTMAELTAACVGSIDRVSVYRTVSLFEELGIAQKIYSGWKYRVELSDTYQAHHHHLSCARCGMVTSISEDKTLERKFVALAEEQGFKVTGHQLEITGLCKSCQ